MEMLQALLMRAFKSKQAKQKQRQAALVKVGTAAAAVPHHNRMLYVWFAAACCAAAAPMWLSSCLLPCVTVQAAVSSVQPV